MEKLPVITVALVLGAMVMVTGDHLPGPAGSAVEVQKRVIAGQTRAAGIIIDFATQDPDLLIAGDAANGSLSVDQAVGDLDGDRVDDLVIGAPWAHRASDAQFAGHVYVFFGGEERPASLTGDSADVTIIGAASQDQIGGGADRQPGTIAIGDVNGDGVGDLVLGMPDARGRSGEVRVIFGRSRNEWEATPTLDLATTPGNVVVSTQGVRSWLGTAVAVGDVNGDGTADLLAGAPGADGPASNRRDAGEVYIFFGRNRWPDTLMAEQDADVRIVGAWREDLLGSGLAVGQLGGTEADDVAMGARGGAGGEVHVLFGSAGLAGTRDLAAMPADWVIFAADTADGVGRYLAIGDVSGDGHSDLAIGVPGGDGPANRRMDAGEVAVLFGPRTAGSMSYLAGGADFTIYGPQGQTTQRPGGGLGDNVTLSDLNGDGVMDVIAGSRQGDGFGNARLNAGEAYVVFGGDLPDALDLNTGEADIAIYGRKSGDFLGRVAAGNLDGTAPDDLALGAHWAKVDNLEGAGEVFVVYRQAAQPTPTSTPTATVPATATPTPTGMTPAPVTATPTPTATGIPMITPTPTVFEYLPLLMKNHSGP